MNKAKRNPQLIIIIAILLATGFVLAQKLNSVVKVTVSDKVLADDGEDGDKVSEADDEDERDDEDSRDDEDKADKEESKRDDEEKNNDDRDEVKSERSKLRVQKFENDDEDEVDDDQDKNDLDDEDNEEDESGEETKDISELITKVERKISAVAANGGNVDGFNATLAEARDLVAQAQAKLDAGDKAGAESLIETAKDKLENLKEAVNLVLGEKEDEEDEADNQAETDDEDEDDSQMAKEYKNVVAQFVHDLKATMELEGIQDGIGTQVSAVAQAQSASQERVVEIIKKIDDRGEFKKFMVGPDLDSLDEIQEEIVKNQSTIQVLTQVLGQTDNANVKIILQRQIEVLKQENLKLENYIAAAENVPSLFGWLVRLFS